MTASAASTRDWSGHSGNVDALIDVPRLSALQVRLYLVCGLVLFCEGYDLQALALAVPAISLELGVAPSTFAVALSASLFGMAIGGAGFAPLGDRFGRKPMLILAMVLTGASTLVALTFADTWWIAACRFVTGIGLGITAVNTAAMMGDYAPARWRFMIMTVLTCFVPGGAFLAAMTAPAVIDAAGWRGIFYVGGFVPLTAAIVVALAMPESLKWLVATKPADARVARIAARVAPGIDTGKLFTVMADGERRSFLRQFHRLLARDLLPRTLVVWLGAVSGAFCLYLLMSWLPTMLDQARWSRTDALRGTAFVQLGGIFGSLLIAWAIDRRHLLLGLVGGYGCSALALLAIGLLPPSVLGWQVLLLLVGAGISGIQGIWMSIAVGLYPLDLRATSGGGVAAVSRIGAISAPLVGGAAMNLGVETRVLLMALVVPIAVSIVAIVFTRRHFVSPPPVTDKDGSA